MDFDEKELGLAIEKALEDIGLPKGTVVATVVSPPPYDIAKWVSNTSHAKTYNLFSSACIVIQEMNN